MDDILQKVQYLPCQHAIEAAPAAQLNPSSRSSNTEVFTCIPQRHPLVLSFFNCFIACDLLLRVLRVGLMYLMVPAFMAVNQNKWGCAQIASASSVLVGQRDGHDLDSNEVVFTFAHIRMPAPGLDNCNLLAGYLSTLRYFNSHKLVPGVRFELQVVTVPCGSLADCRNLSSDNEAIVSDFIQSLGNFSMIIKSNYLIAERIVDAALSTGIPVINPDDLRSSAFRPGAENIVHFHQSWQQQAEHVFTFMMQDERCAYSAILHDANSTSGGEEYRQRIAAIVKLFTDGSFESPPELDVSDADRAEFKRFFTEDTPRRRCFIVLGTSALLFDLLGRLVASDWYVPDNYRFYGFSTMSNDEFKLNGSAAHFGTTTFTHWTPGFVPDRLEEAYAEWRANVSTDEISLLTDNESFADDPTMSTVQGYMVLAVVLESARTALARSSLFANRSLPRLHGRPLPWGQLVDTFYSAAKEVDGHWFNHLVRSCPRYPEPQDNCFCNSLTSRAYIYRVNATTGRPFIVYDDESLGQRDIASVSFTGSCGYKVSSWSYPITALATYPARFIGQGMREADLIMSFKLFQEVFGEMTRISNYAPTPPTRALRYTAQRVKETEDVDTVLHHYIDTLNPFVIYGTMSNNILDSGKVLTLASNLLGNELEDPPLVPHDQWKSNIVELRPSQADFIHSLATYYQSRSGRYTSLHAIAATIREAELISMSLATRGFDFPASNVVVSGEAAVWASQIRAWLSDSASYNPFVIASSNNNDHSEVMSTAVAAVTVGRGTLAIATPSASIRKAREAIGTIDSSAVLPSFDIVFGAFRREWWTPQAYQGVPGKLQKYVADPSYHIAMLSFDVAQQLAAQVYFDYKTTAAEVLYRMSTLSAGDTSFGPFYNTTCTPEQIKANTRQRQCQCTKGLRTIFIQSVRDYINGVNSDRTGRYAYTMTTCGVVYQPYVPPALGVVGAAALSDGAVAGIAVGSSAFVLAFVAALVFSMCCLGRNNRAAPTDPSRPFAIVFTDIQSSTNLWARAPLAMSEAVEQHHRVMRKALRVNSGYEVKTVGDSFMVAFKSADDAVQFSLDAQRDLYEAEWNSEIDATYVELLLEAEASRHHAHEKPSVGTFDRKSETGNETVPFRNITAVDTFLLPNQNLEPPADVRDDNSIHSAKATDSHCSHQNDRTLWHGLRVRIGVHCGTGEIRKDPVSLGYDYYGTVVNTAARVEGVGHGGQILVTEDAFSALSAGYIPSSRAVVVCLGPQPLRGLDEPIKLYQIEPESLRGRHFPPLRLHVEKEAEDDETLTATAENETGTGAAMSEDPEAIIARLCSLKQFSSVITADDLHDRFSFFTQTFAPTSSKYKLSVIAKLAEAWGFDKKEVARATSADASEAVKARIKIRFLAKVTKAYNVANGMMRSENKQSPHAVISNVQKVTNTTNNTINKSQRLPLFVDEISSTVNNTQSRKHARAAGVCEAPACPSESAQDGLRPE